MTNQKEPAISLETLFDTPTWYPREIDFSRKEILLLHMDRKSYVRSSFLDQRTSTVDDQAYMASLNVLADSPIRTVPRPVNYIFHTAFCGSTLLSRCLDRPSKCLAYREPFMLDQLSAIKRALIKSNPSVPEHQIQVPLLNLVIALLSRTYSDSEVPLIKPTDSCINLARELLSAQNESAGLLLYSTLEDFLVTMLKDDRRIYVRGLVERARIDLKDWQPLPSIDTIKNLSDAQTAGFVWVGLMRRYLDLLTDEKLVVRSLDSSLFFARPTETLRACTQLFKLSLTDNDIDTAIEHIFTQDAKNPTTVFDKENTQKKNQYLATKLTDEINEGVHWVTELTRDQPIPAALPKPLLPQ